MALNKYSKGGVTYFQLYISCPVCHEEGLNTPHSYWTHAQDGGDIYVGDDASYQCRQCGHTKHVSAWRYGCPSHSGDADEYIYKNLKSPAPLAAVMACAGMMVTECGMPWLQAFMANLESGWR